VTTLHGQNKDALAKMQKGNWRYDVVEAGYKCNMADILAAIGLVELERYDNDTLIKRKSIYKQYSDSLSKFSWAIIPAEGIENPRSETSFHLFPLRIKGISEAQRDEIIQKIFDKDVSVNVHFIPVPMMSFYKAMGYDIKNYPNTFKLYSNEISLPVFYDLTEEQVEQVIKAVIDSVQEVIK
ncbi:MAG: DegT/DnrJ/EryC1/StrS family aminotransferase, partial [Bacteroidota bacterium]